MRKKVVIMGAAGRDFHNFNVLFRDDPGCEVVAFTATQIPFINNRTYPKALSGPLYPEGVPVYPEEKLAELIKQKKIDEVVFAYSDVSHEYVMHRASLSVALGADFRLIGSEKTFLGSSRPVISVCAVRTGAGKSGVTRFIAKELKKAGKRAVAIRHPMPYGNLERQKAQRFERLEDLKRAECTIEEMEEYEPLIDEGIAVFAGVDYGEVLKRAEKEADIIVWDGGNNDLPFIRPDLEIVVADPLRAGQEVGYWPGEANLRRAHAVIINKASSAAKEKIDIVVRNINKENPSALIIKTSSTVTSDESIAGRNVLVIEDGPTLTHGGMNYGAGIEAARLYKANPVDVRPYAVGTIRDTLEKYATLKNLLPAMGYSRAQMRELAETIEKTPCEAVLVATPVDLARIISIKKPCFRVRYEVEDIETPGLKGLVADFLKRV